LITKGIIQKKLSAARERFKSDGSNLFVVLSIIQQQQNETKSVLEDELPKKNESKEYK